MPTESDAIYGIHPVQEALRAGRRHVQNVWIDEKAPADRFRSIQDLARRQTVQVTPVSRQILFERCGTRQHQGVVLDAGPFPYTPLTDSIFERKRLLLLDNIEDPRNAGAILRSADLFGFQTILLPIRGGAAIYPSVIKTSAGAAEHLEIVREANTTAYFKRARKCGYRTVVLDMQGETELSAVPPDDGNPLLLILGGEDKRVGQYLLNEACVVARIPQSGHINSLNASVAAGIALYHFSSGRA
jgi:23S rRNA (guanosine2251-2'-O)-methyltransferase